jgi:alanine dehydrogenase
VDLDRSDSDEPAKHRDAIEALAEELSRPVSEVKDAYESEFARLKQGARVTDYLALFASRKAREALVGGQRNKEQSGTVDGRGIAEPASPRTRGRAG